MADSLKILVVEDELITATDIRETLQKAGHTVIATARNFRDAIDAVSQQVPDVALVDIHLGNSSPDTDGIAVAKVLQATYRIPVVYLTAHSEDATFLRAKETLPAAYLLKPFRHRELALQIELAYYHFRVNQHTLVHPAIATDLFLPINKGHEKIVKSDVVYLQADGAYVKIHLADKKPARVVAMNLGYLKQFFPTPNFYALSRSLIINLNYLERVEGAQLFLIHESKPMVIPERRRKALISYLPIVRSPAK